MVIVGAGAVGRSIARRLGNGRKLVIADVDPHVLDQACSELVVNGYDAVGRLVDVSDRAAVRDLARRASKIGHVRQVVHAAGVRPCGSTVETILKVDLLGVALVLEEFAEVISPGAAGVVITTMAGHLSAATTPEQEQALADTPADRLLDLPFLAPTAIGAPAVAYVIANRGAILRARSAMNDWGRRGGRINSISTGAIPITAGHRGEATGADWQRQMLVGLSLAPRFAPAVEVAAVTEFLLNSRTDFISGADLPVDAGLVAATRRLVLGRQWMPPAQWIP
jgi:NAD(P)-dependent dehydrogenase (short-subunit alcohol dehydrogenase family)